MKVVLTGMFDRQLATLADELRAEFPEIKVTVVGNDNPRSRVRQTMEGAALVVSGRFVSHGLQYYAGVRRIPFRVAHSGVNGIRNTVREFLLGGRAA